MICNYRLEYLHNGGSTYDATPPIDTAWPIMLIKARVEPLDTPSAMVWLALEIKII